MTPSAGRSFRRRTLSETMAQWLSSQGTVSRRVRRGLRPLAERLFVPRRGLEAVLPGGERVRIARSCRHVTWNPEEYQTFRSAVRPGQVVFDIGANAGAYAILFGQWVGEAGRVYAFEPDPQAYDGLVRQVGLNGVEGRVVPIASAVAGERCVSAPLHVSPSTGASHLSGQSDAGAWRLIQVAVTSIDAFCAERGVLPDVVKVDVEGSELDVLRGARQTVAALGDRALLYVEMHPSRWPSLGIDFEDIRRECGIQGLSLERIDGGGGDVRPLEGVCLRLRGSRR
ncbi:MAG TPA: FkbM family methyltransferase [Vicinamibacterales bacterium]|nr:FkbM family methyltransferase [Vicinamibacterales bacterium]